MFFDRVPERRKNCDGPIKFLFLGQAGPRKGIHLLLKAFSKIPPAAASLLIVGDLQVPAETFAKYRDRVILMPTVPRSQVRDILANSDCLVLPTYFEGAGIVLYEALASGIGIIQSRNAALAAAPNVGLIIPELTEAALHSALMTVIDDRKRLLDWQHAAKAEANHYTFANYRQAVGAEIRRLEIAGRTQTCTR
nr:glycosyltransferase family 4 protein [Bradyrhizobium ottawaense]